jgi:hypothetical protein
VKLKSEVAELLTFMAVFDRRTVTALDVEGWYLLDVIQRNDLDTCKAAVVRFFNSEPDERGNVAWLDPQNFRRAVRFVKRDREVAESKLRAVGQAVSGEGVTCLHAKRVITEGAGEIVTSCLHCNEVLESKASIES